MKICLILFICLCLDFYADEKLDILIEKTQDLASISGNFQQTRFISSIQKNIQSSGYFKYDKMKGLDWMTLSPFKTHLYINERGAWRVEKEKKDRVKGVQQFMQKSILKFFDLDEQKLTKEFELTISSEQKELSLQLTPKSFLNKKAFKYIRLTFDEYLLTEVYLLNPNEKDYTKLTFSHLILKNK